MRLITSSHITDWANRRKHDCQETLPLLVRRLVQATADRIDRIDFPCGDAVSEEGWDGRLVCTSRHPCVPGGVSGWEIGTDRSASEKAGSEYGKRSRDPLDLNPADTTFVFVTPRAWPQRHGWARTQRDLGQWRDVRVVAASDIEQWLEAVPAVALWLAQHLGIAPSNGLEGIERWWESWAEGTDPIITPAMMLAGRNAEAKTVEEWFTGNGADHEKIEVQSDSPDESLAFLRAAADRWPETTQKALFARCVVAETKEAFDVAAAWTIPAVIATSTDVTRSVSTAMRNGHRLFLAVGRTWASRGSGPMQLPNVDRYALEQAIEEAGMPRAVAAAIAADCGGSITVMHRRRSKLDAVKRPIWASQDHGRALIPALLAGAWSEEVRPTNIGPFGPPPPPLLDRAVLCALAGRTDYDTVVAPVQLYGAEDDSPFRNAGDVWRLTAPLDAWYLLAYHVQKEDLTRLAKNAFEVLSLRDPKYELPDTDQWWAASLGKQRSHSGWLREGIAISLAIVAQHGETLRLKIPYGTAEDFVGGVVRGITNAAIEWHDWASLDDIMPILAEAAPTSFLAAVESLIETQPDEVRQLLSDGVDRIGGECRHAGLLWGLERVAWHPGHLIRVVLSLAKLDGVDPGGRWGNRPFNTLSEVLLEGVMYFREGRA